MSIQPVSGGRTNCWASGGAVADSRIGLRLRNCSAERQLHACAFAGDVGLAGPDRGEGGKYLLLPPGYMGTVPDGYFVYRPLTNNVFVFLANAKSTVGDVADKP